MYTPRNRRTEARRQEIAVMRTPDGHSRLEMSRFLAPPVIADYRSARVNAFGYLRVMFTVEDIDDTLARLGKRGAALVAEVVRYEDTYRLCYIRGAEGNLGVSTWLLAGTTTTGEQIRVRGVDLFEFRHGKIIKKDSYWKIIER